MQDYSRKKGRRCKKNYKAKKNTIIDAVVIKHVRYYDSIMPIKIKIRKNNYQRGIRWQITVNVINATDYMFKMLQWFFVCLFVFVCLFFWLPHTACGTLVPDQESNPGYCSKSARS